MGIASWLEEKHANSTRRTMASAFETNLRRSRSDDPARRQLDAMVHAHRIRRRMNKMPSDEETVVFEVMPFAYLSQEKCRLSFAEYVLYTEMPNHADVDFLHESVVEGLNAFLDDEDVHPAQFYWFLIKLDGCREFVPWGAWLDTKIICKIVKIGLMSRDKLDSQPHHNFVDEEIAKYASG